MLVKYTASLEIDSLLLRCSLVILVSNSMLLIRNILINACYVGAQRYDREH